MLRFLGFLFAAGCFLFVVAALGAGYVLWHATRDLPDYSQLAQYEPAVMTRIHAADGSLLAEYARERRLFVPASAIPERIVQAFLSAEDKNFYEHGGLDWQGVVRAVVVNAQNLLHGNRRLVGASTITQQVAKNFLLSSEQRFDRKIKEALLAQRIEQALSKEQILELYLNEIYLGLGTYGIAAASLHYFGKSLTELSLAEMAYLAALPKGPNNYHPFKFPDRAQERRNWVIERMVENRYVSEEEAGRAMAEPFRVSLRPPAVQLFAAEFFAEEVRREVLALYGEEKLYGGGLSVRTTLDPKLQIFARQAVTRGLLKYDRQQGWRGAESQVPLGGDWGERIADLSAPGDIAPWRLAVVLETTDQEAVIGLQPQRQADGALDKTRATVRIPLSLMAWARRMTAKGVLGPPIKSVREVVTPGDVVYAAPSTQEGLWHLVQMPEIDGGLVAMDPHTGRVLALVGGFSYGKSQFNRAIQAHRQPGSSFKPFVYAAALDNGYTPSSVVLDAPIEVVQPNGEVWKPKNYSGKYHGPSTLRRGIELSRNVMTVRLAQDMGMQKVEEMAERLGIYDQMMPVLAMALGAGETTLLRMTAGYAMIANGGKRIQPTLIDRIQDRYGKTVVRHDRRQCQECQVPGWRSQPEPDPADAREQIVNPYTAYQITSMLEGVVQRGTGQIVRTVGKPLAGKTGTTNEEKDAWFVGFSPDLVVGVYVGYDTPRAMGKQATGGELSAPIFADFMKLALRDKAAIPFRVPAGVQLIPIDPQTGQRAAFGEKSVILEAFKPGEGPAEDTVVIGGGSFTQVPVIEGGLTTGTGGLY